MVMLMGLVYAMLLGCLSLTTHIHGQQLQDKSGFISIDCGMPKGYDEGGTYYSSDDKFVNTGINSNISAEFKTENPRLANLRSFPQGTRNCYTLRPKQGKNNTYLIRAWFKYGNYDGQNNPPKFDIYIGVNRWRSFNRYMSDEEIKTEIMYMASTDYIHVCLLDTDEGTPFISALELKHLNGPFYNSKSGCMSTFERDFMGSSLRKWVKDELGRSWSHYPMNDSENISTDLEINSQGSNEYQLNLPMMKRGVKALNASDSSLQYYWGEGWEDAKFYVYLHFCDVEKTKEGELREFDILLNGSPWLESIKPGYLMTTTVRNEDPIGGAGYVDIRLTLVRTNNSTLPPILNALEIYAEKELPVSPTVPEEFDAMVNISFTYEVKKNWRGDPCVPRNFSWHGVNCSYIGNNSQVTVLNLSSSNLNGEIAPSLSSLKSLRYLDLSNNSLTGVVPEFLAQLPNLESLNLAKNNLRGSVPKALRDKSSLQLSIDGNRDLCLSDSCGKKKRNTIAIVASVVSTMTLLSAIAIFWSLKRRRRTEGRTLKQKNRRFTYAEVVTITNNFQRVIGKGGFGTVYLGYLEDGTEVAVKILSRSISLGSEQFWTEAELLTTVHHRNVASLIGYCDQGSNTALLYEYMANGNLKECLLDKNKAVLTWEQRLKIAIDAVQALEYLHSGCKPPIIHRDIKTSNILLTEKLQAKVADFGLSKIFPVEDGSHVSTGVVGTFGYLDPEYCKTGRLTEKSDVYSFGVVLLELITGQPAVIKSQDELITGQPAIIQREEHTHIVQWVMPMLERGEINSIVDPRLQGDFDNNSVWKALETAKACVPSSPIQRLTMSQVLGELTECLKIYAANGRPLAISEVNNMESSNGSDYLHHSLDREPSMSGPESR